MPELNGVEAVRELLECNLVPFPAVIYITGHPDFAVDAYELSAVDYLMKPYTFERIDKAIEKLREEVRHKYTEFQIASTTRPLERVSIKVGHEILVLDMDNIIILHSDKGKTFINCLNDKSYKLYKPLSEVHRRLDPGMFFRSHRCYVINLKKVERISPWETSAHLVQFKDCTHEALITKARLQDLKHVLRVVESPNLVSFTESEIATK